MKLTEQGLVGEIEMPKDGWFRDHFMELLLGKEIMELERYPLKHGHWFKK